MHDEFKDKLESEAMPRYGNWKFPRSPSATQPDLEDCVYSPPFFTCINYSRDILYLPVEKLASPRVSTFDGSWAWLFLAYLAASNSGPRVRNIAFNSSIISYDRSSSSLGRICCPRKFNIMGHTNEHNVLTLHTSVLGLERIYIVWGDVYGSAMQDIFKPRKQPFHLTQSLPSEANDITKEVSTEALRVMLLWICTSSLLGGFSQAQLRNLFLARFSRVVEILPMGLVRKA
jgi:hypothetical protein